ncbi:MAG TPA: c-type cytochrome [Rhizomicrobium sp.]|jgi:cytochrome c oxidase cbb3-type subunit 3|nr:c-type cytochrome [Rhizomicrobium sp.]
MANFHRVVAGIAIAIIAVVAIGLALIVMPGAEPNAALHLANDYGGVVPAGAMLRVPVTGVYPGGRPAGLNPDMKNPLANDPDAAQRGMKDFNTFNCVGCHADNGGGGMGPSLSDNIWIYRSSPGNIYMTIVQGRAYGMPAFGAMLPDRTVWELVSYIQSISEKPGPHFGRTTSLSPPLPDHEQVPANAVQTSSPWNYIEPLPPRGGKPGTK